MGGLVLSGVPSVLVIMRCRVGVIDLFVILFTLPQTSIIPAKGGAATGAVWACCRVERESERARAGIEPFKTVERVYVGEKKRCRMVFVE